MTLGRALACTLTIAAVLFAVFAAPPVRASAMGIALEGFPYPYPVRFMPLTLQGEDLRLAYMDVAPVGSSNGCKGVWNRSGWASGCGRRAWPTWPRRTRCGRPSRT